MGRRDWIALALLALALAIAVFAVGSAPRWAQAAVAFATGLAVLSTLLSKRGFERWPPLLLILFGATAWTLVQWLPLPHGIVTALTPTLDALREDGAQLVAVSPPSTLSMDPTATLRALTFFVTLTGVAILALRLSISERGRYALMSCVAGVAGLAAAVTGIHELVNATQLYGIYEPQHGLPTIMGPLLNTNHLGCLMAVGVTTSVGLFFYPKQTSMRRAWWVAIAIACLAVTMSTLSRGAVLGLAIGVAVVLFALIAQRVRSIGDKSRRRRERFFATTVPIGIMVVCGLTVAVYLGAGTVMHQLENTSLQEIHAPTSKFAAWRSSFTLVDESPWVGIGRGAFESTFTRVHPASAFATFSNPENEALQAVVEWGLPVSLALGACTVWLLFVALRRWNDTPLASGALGAVAAVVFQSNFDFGMELLGLAVPVTMLVAVLTYVPLRELDTRRLMRLRIARIVHGLLIFVGGALLLSAATRTVGDDHRDLASTATTAQIHASIARHPLDYYNYALLAERLVRTNDPAAIPVLNHALRLHPTHSGLHRVAARMLVKAKRIDQAVGEYATAIRYSKDPRALLIEIVAILDPEHAMKAIPLELEIGPTLQTLDRAERANVSILWLERVLEYKQDLRASDALYTLAMREKNYGAAERALRHRCRLIPGTRCKLEMARVLELAAKPREVIVQLDDVAHWSGRNDDRLAAWLMLCDAHIALKDRSSALECLRRFEVSGLVKPGDPMLQQRRDALQTEPVLIPKPGD